MEYVEGMREQGEGVRFHHESDFAPLKACIVGNADTIWMPDPDTPELANLFKDSTDDEFMAYLRKHAGKELKDSDPEMAEKLVMESDALAATYREHGVKVIRNETGSVPDELANWHTGWGGPKFVSIFGQSCGEVLGNTFVNLWEVSPVRGMELQHRDALLEIMAGDPDSTWVSMPPPPPSVANPTPDPFVSPGDPRIFPNKLCLLGIGVTDPSHIDDRSKPRSSGNEVGAEVLRRMMAPFGWRVEVVYFNSSYTYHIDALMMEIGEGLIGLPPNALWTDLPDELADWEIIEIDPEEQKLGVCNSVVLDESKVVMTAGAPKTAEAISKRGIEPVEVPYQNIYNTFGSGIHCSTTRLWAES